MKMDDSPPKTPDQIIAASRATSADKFTVVKSRTSSEIIRPDRDAPSLTTVEDENFFLTNKMELFGDADQAATVRELLQEYNTQKLDLDDQDTGFKQKANLGVVLGVFFPCLQNIFGVIYFVRLYWIVGEAGSIEAFGIVFSCCCVSLLTSLSISAIATNGRVSGGGNYLLISRSLGPEFGGSVGILFYLGISVSVAMYLAGSIELMLEYILPQLNIFEDKFDNARLYGTALLFIVASLVFMGVKILSKVAFLVLCAVLVAIASIYVGIFFSSPETSIKVCYLGEHLVVSKKITVNGTIQCHKNASGPMYQLMCSNGTCHSYFDENPALMKPAFPGLTMRLFEENAFNKYGEDGTLIENKDDGLLTNDLFIYRDITTSFVVLMAIYFPSITGFEQGSSYSGDLEDAQKSIPTGTLAAVFVTSCVYLSTVLLFSATVEGNILRDKFGNSIGNKLIMSQLSWPDPWVLLIGALMSTVGAGLQALAAAPRLLQAIAKDNVFPFLHAFGYLTKNNEPLPAIALSVCIAEVGIIIANLDYVAPIVTMFFLICYGFVNFACALQSLLGSPHWRPRFRFYHWTGAMMGVALCLSLMFLSSWYYTLATLFLALFLYKYIEYKGAEKEWGDGMRGLAMSAARYALLRLKTDMIEGNTKNWRPQLLLLVKLSENYDVQHPRQLSLASQLKAGKGLTIVSSIIPGSLADNVNRTRDARLKLMLAMEKENMKGFANVVAAENLSQGLCHVIQNSGLGALHPNMVMVCWPEHWYDVEDPNTYRIFIDSLCYAQTANQSIMVAKGMPNFPTNEDRLKGTIDIWWIMNDGSVLIMLGFLLSQSKTWRGCKLRLFTVAQIEDNSVQMKRDLQQYMYNLRIPAQVEVVEMEDKDISAYINERTLKMEERTRMMSQMNLKRKETAKVVDVLLDKSHSRRCFSVKEQEPSMSTMDEKGNLEESSVDIRVKEVLRSAAEPDSFIQGILSAFSNIVEDPQELQAEEPQHKDGSETDVQTDKDPLPQSDVDKGMQTLLTHSQEDVSVQPRRVSNFRKMNQAVRLNQMLQAQSTTTQLVIINLPSVPSVSAKQANYMNFLEVLQEGLDRVLMIRGTGKEVITIYN